MLPDWLSWARQLQAVAQSGLTFARDPYDRERYEQIRALAAKIMAEGSGADLSHIEGLFTGQSGYATPKVDMRAAIFRDASVLLVSEKADGGRWTMPGGWADVNTMPSENVEREVREEAGLIVKARKLAAVFDRDKSGHPSPLPFHVYKMFFLCDVEGECEKSELETAAVKYFPIDDLPELSLERLLPRQIQRLYEHYQSPSMPTDFD